MGDVVELCEQNLKAAACLRIHNTIGTKLPGYQAFSGSSTYVFDYAFLMIYDNDSENTMNMIDNHFALLSNEETHNGYSQRKEPNASHVEELGPSRSGLFTHPDSLHNL